MLIKLDLLCTHINCRPLGNALIIINSYNCSAQQRAAQAIEANKIGVNSSGISINWDSYTPSKIYGKPTIS